MDYVQVHFETGQSCIETLKVSNQYQPKAQELKDIDLAMLLFVIFEIGDKITLLDEKYTIIRFLFYFLMA
jgi:hypothetical protein